MRRHPVELVGSRLSKVSKIGTNLGELSDADESERAEEHLSKHTWPLLIPKKNQETWQKPLVTKCFIETNHVWKFIKTI